MVRLRPVLATLVLAPTFVVGAAAPAAAQEACDLIDEYGQLSDVEGLRAAVQAAEAETGVDFMVYAVDQLPSSGNLDAELAAGARISCPQAFDAPANVADNTVLLAVSVGDRFTAFSYGDDLDERLDDDSADIVNRMNTFFADGAISAGLSSGVGGAVEGLDTVPPDYATPIGTGVVGTAAVVGGGAWLYTRRRTQRGRAAESARLFELSSTRVTDVQARWFDAEQSATMVGDRITGGAMARLDAAQLAAAQASRALYEAWSPVSEVTADDVGGMSDEDQAEVAGHVAEATAVVEAAESTVGELEAMVEELRGKPDALLETHRLAGEAVTRGLHAADARAAEGWEVAAGRQRLATMSAELSGVDPIAMRIDVDRLETELSPLAAEIHELVDDLESLEDRWKQTHARRDDMGPEIEGQRGRAMQMRSMIHGWSASHASTSFDELLGHPDEADRQLERAAGSLVSVQQLGDLPRDLGMMQTVDRELDSAQTAIDLADELLDEGDELDVLLAAAKEGSGPAVANAAEDAALLLNYVNEHRNDVPSRAPGVARRVAELHDHAEAALRLAPPDHLQAMELAGQIESIVNTELDEFRTEVGQRERQRNQAQSELRSAGVAVDRADRHVSSHAFSSRADKNAQAQIDQLRHRLSGAQVALENDPAAALAEATTVEQEADEIYREAQRRQRHRGPGGFGGGFGGGIIIGGGGFRGHGGGRHHRGGGWGGGGGGGFGGGFGGGSVGGWGGGGGGFGGGSSGSW
jgi:hypothetical protein